MSKSSRSNSVSEMKLDPLSFFKTAMDVVHDPGLSRDDKHGILKSMELDAKELLKATEENMGGDDDQGLKSVRDALLALEEGHKKSE